MAGQWLVATEPSLQQTARTAAIVRGEQIPAVATLSASVAVASLEMVH